MPVFIEARTDPFQAQRDAQASNQFGRGTEPVRRPTRGYQLKDDTYAVIRVMGANGEFVPVIDAAGETVIREEAGRFSTFWTNFFVQNVAEERHEKQQIVETFGESFIFFFGEAPRMLQVNGLLLNTADFNWRAEFWENYERFFRGTRLVEQQARLYLIYDDQIIEGYMVGANASENTNLPQVINFGFQMFVTGYTNISRIGDPDFPSPPNEIDYRDLSSYDQAIRMWENNRNLQTELSTDAVDKANKYALLGSGALISNLIRNGLANFGDPSVSGFLGTATLAASTALTVASVVNSLFGGGGGASMGPRTLPLRTTFLDNDDEFIGGSEQTPSARELAEGLSLWEKWLNADRSILGSILGMVGSVTATLAFSPPQVVELPHPTETQEYWDLMGQAGRASQEIKDAGGHRNRNVTIRRGLTVGDNSQPRPPILARDVPYGIITSAGELL